MNIIRYDDCKTRAYKKIMFVAKHYNYSEYNLLSNE